MALIDSYKVEASLTADFAAILRTASLPASQTSASLYFFDEGITVFVRVAVVSEAGLGVPQPQRERVLY